MGYSLTSYVFYGIPLAETDEESDVFDEDILDTVGEWPYDSSDINSGNYIENANERKKEYGIDTLVIGVMDWTYYAVAVKESITRSDYSEAEFTPQEAKPEWNEKLKAWCEELGVEYRQPKWYVAAAYW